MIEQEIAKILADQHFYNQYAESTEPKRTVQALTALCRHKIVEELEALLDTRRPEAYGWEQTIEWRIKELRELL